MADDNDVILGAASAITSMTISVMLGARLDKASATVLVHVGIPFLTVLISVPSQRLGVHLNKSILHDFSRL